MPERGVKNEGKAGKMVEDPLFWKKGKIETNNWLRGYKVGEVGVRTRPSGGIAGRSPFTWVCRKLGKNATSARS